MPGTIQDEYDWYKRENDRAAARDAQTKLLTKILIIQLVLYFILWINELDDLDEAIDKLICLKKTLHRADIDVDYPWMRYKQEILNLAVPLPDMCADAALFDKFVLEEGKGIDLKSTQVANESCRGIPTGWDIKEGESFAALSQSYTGAILANSAKRRMERFQKNKIKLVLAGQQAARMNIRPAIDDLNASVGIHTKLADVFAQGFNSAGVALGSLYNKAGGVS